MWRRYSESKVSKRGAAKLPVLFESVSTGSFLSERGSVTSLSNDNACRAIERAARRAVRCYFVLANAQASMNADKDTGYGKTLAWASFIRVLSKWMLN
jgi:hypothetical protein